MALFEKLSSSSSPQEIADAYAEFTGLAGGDNPANQKLAIDYLSNLGVATPSINQAYNLYTTPTTTVSGLPTNTTTNTTSNVTTTGGGLSNLTTDTTSNLGLTTGTTGSDVTTVTGGAGTDTTSGLSTLNNTAGSTATSVVGASGVDTTGGLSTLNNITTAPASNITNSGLTGQAGQGAIEGDDIETQIAQLPKEYANWVRSDDGRFMDFIRKSDGEILKRTVYSPGMSNLDLLKIGLSFIPGAGQILAVLNVADAFRTGNIANAVIGATGLMPGMANVNTALRVGQAVDQNNPFGAITALAGNSDLQKYFGANNLTIGGYTAKDAVSAANLYQASQNGNLAGVITSAGSLINSPDTVLAGRALAVMKAAESGNPNALSMAVAAFNSAGGGGTSTTTGTTKVADSVPLTEDEIADLNEDQLRVYNESGVAGLRDYNRAIKNLTSLTTSGLTGGSMGSDDTTTGTTIGGLTGNTRSLTGTGALTTATTTDQFEDLLITSLRSQGLNNDQISTYLENLNSQSSGLSDIGLLAFRQAKISGATDAEALAAANLASGKTTVVTDTGTEVELIVTDTNIDTDSETSIYSFYETQSEFETGTELVITSGRETGQVTESGTETDSGILITDVNDTTLTRSLTPVVNKETETETGTEEEVVVTTASETETQTEIITEVIVTTASETETETITEIVVTTSSETEIETITEIIVTTSSETESESETITEIIVTTSSETETESETITEIIVTTSSETKTETETESETITEIIVTTSSETKTETETITEIIITDTLTESETETITKIVTTPVLTQPPTVKSGSFMAGTPATGGRGKPNEFLKENLLKTYMNKQSFKDPLAEFNKARTEMMKDDMMQQGVDPRLAAILAAKMNGEEAPKAPTYNYGEEPSSIDDILGLKGEGDQNFAKGGYVQPLMAQGGMALPLLAAKGGLPTMHKGREDFRGGKHVAGEGDGQSDDIPAMLADGEFVFPADVVSALGNGSTKAGTDKLYEMMHSIRDRARSKGRKHLPPPALKSPLDYLKKR